MIPYVLEYFLEYSGDYRYDVVNRRYVGQGNCDVKFSYRPMPRVEFEILKLYENVW